jgi:hypothetical protein
MLTSTSRAIAAATVAVMALGAAAVPPAAAADFGQVQMTRPDGLTDVSWRGRGSNAAVLGAVGTVFGTIAALAAADAYRNSHPYYPYGYSQPAPYYGGYAYAPRPGIPFGGWHGGWHHHRG